MKNSKKLLRGLYLMLPVIVMSVIIGSCYYDYGLDANNYDLVGTYYNTDYNFNNVNKFYLVDTVFHVGTGSVTSAYDTQIKNEIRSNLINLGWTQGTIVDTGNTSTVVIAAAVTSGTITIIEDEEYCWYDYWGYPYCDDYSYSTTYATGTVAMLMSDLHQRNGTRIPVQWSGVINGLAGSGTGNVSQRITTTINKAFTQSPYLKKN